MLAIEINNKKPQLCQRPQPIPFHQQVLIEVIAAGINRPDIMQCQGLYPPPAGASDILGLEVAGVIIGLGDDVKNWQIGDKVCSLVTGGGYAQYCVADAGSVLAIPKGLTMIQAASLPETFFTVWHNLFQLGQLSATESLLIHGGSSGIGTTAIQLAKAFGAIVYVTAGSDEKCRRCIELGADVAINYKSQDFVDYINQHHQGVNLILDMIGGDYLPRNIKALTSHGRLIQIGLQHGIKAELNLLAVMTKRLTLTGSTLRARDSAFKAQIAQQLQQKVWPLLENKSIQPVIDRIFPLEQASKAHQYMESSQHTGKIVLSVEKEHKTDVNP